MPFIFDLEEILENTRNRRDKQTVSAILAVAERLERMSDLTAEHQETMVNLEKQLIKWQLGGNFEKKNKNANKNSP